MALALVVGRGRRWVAAHADAQRFRFPSRVSKMRLCDGRPVAASLGLTRRRRRRRLISELQLTATAATKAAAPVTSSSSTAPLEIRKEGRANPGNVFFGAPPACASKLPVPGGPVCPQFRGHNFREGATRATPLKSQNPQLQSLFMSAGASCKLVLPLFANWLRAALLNASLCWVLRFLERFRVLGTFRNRI